MSVLGKQTVEVIVYWCFSILSDIMTAGKGITIPEFMKNGHSFMSKINIYTKTIQLYSYTMQSISSTNNNNSTIINYNSIQMRH